MGVPESTPQLFGNSWKTLSACVPLVPGSLLDPCDVHLQAGEDWGPGGSWGFLGGPGEWSGGELFWERRDGNLK